MRASLSLFSSMNRNCLATSPGAEQQHAFARQAVAARAAGFLIVALDIFWQVVVDDEADVGFVDAHAERDGGADHADFVAEEQFLVFAAFLRRQARVIGFRALMPPRSAFGHALGAFAAWQ